MKLKTIRIAIIVLALLVGGTIFLVTSIKQKAEFNAPRANLETITPDELRDGLFVEGNIYEMWDEFAYTTEYKTTLGVKHDQKNTDRYYALPMEYSFYKDAPMLIAVCTRDKSEISTFDRMSDEINKYYEDGTELKTTTHFVGKVQKLKGEYLGFFKEYVAYQFDISEAEAAQYYTPYVIRSWKEDNSTSGIIIGAIMTALGLGGTAFFVIGLVKGKRGF